MEEFPLDLSKNTTLAHNQSLLNDSGVASAEQSFDWTEITTDQPLDLTTRKGFDPAHDLPSHPDQTLKATHPLPGFLVPSSDKGRPPDCSPSQHDLLITPPSGQPNPSPYHTPTPRMAHSNQASGNQVTRKPMRKSLSEPSLPSSKAITKPLTRRPTAQPVPIAPKLPSRNGGVPVHSIYSSRSGVGGGNVHTKCYTSASSSPAECSASFKYKDTEEMCKPVAMDAHRAEPLDTSQNPFLASPHMDLSGIQGFPYYDHPRGLPFSQTEMCRNLLPQVPFCYDYLKAPFTKVDSLFTPPTGEMFDAGAIGSGLGMNPGAAGKQRGLTGSRIKTSLQYVNPFNRKNLNFVATKVLHEWFAAHIDYPYPTNEEVHLLATTGNVTEVQVRKWLANRRLRTGNTFKYAYSRKRHPFMGLNPQAHHYLPSATTYRGDEGRAEGGHQTWMSTEAYRRETEGGDDEQKPQRLELRSDL